MTLLPCTSCRRHVEVSTKSCPFCGGGLALVAPRARPIAGRLSRSAVMALGASAIVVGCGGNDPGQVAALYGVPAPDTGVSADSTSDTGTSDTGTSDTGTSDAGKFDAGADVTPDARTDADAAIDTGAPAPPYGIPPTDAG